MKIAKTEGYWGVKFKTSKLYKDLTPEEKKAVDHFYVGCHPSNFPPDKEKTWWKVWSEKRYKPKTKTWVPKLMASWSPGSIF